MIGHPIYNDHLYNPEEYNAQRYEEGMKDAYLDDPSQSFNSEEMRIEKEEFHNYDESCDECIRPPRDPDLADSQITLHSLLYSSANHHFVAPLPYWFTALSTLTPNDLLSVYHDSSTSRDSHKRPIP